MALLDAHLKARSETQKMPRPHPSGAQMASDGHHYLADPKRPGKYLVVVHHG
jgi:hypothetical protein